MDESLDSSIYTQERESDMEDLNDSTDVEIIEPARLPHSPPSNPAATPSVPQPLRSGQTSSYSPSPKRRRNEETENLPKPSISNLNETSMEEGEVCSVCFEPYETMGKHRLACLKCGHLFGHSCIERWLPVGSKGGSCPQCKKKATRKDIRIIYAKGVRVADNSEAEWTKQELEAVRSEKRLIEMELAEVRLKLQTQIELNSSLQSRLQTVSQIDSVSFAGPSRSAHVAQSNMGSIGFRLLKTIEFSKDSECRVMDFCPDMSLLVCSQVCVNALFPGHGVKKINMAYLKASDYLPLHSKLVRDVKFSPDAPGVLLSVGEDKFMKLTNMYSNSSMHSFDIKSPGWSCAWKAREPHYVFAGLSNGSVVMYDTRMLLNSSQDSTNHVVTISNVNVARTPVVSLQWISCASQLNNRSSGLLVGHSNRSVFYECVSPTEYKPHILPITGNLLSMSYDAGSNNFLASYRPSQIQNEMFDRHLLCELTSQNLSADPNRIDPVYSCNVINTQRGCQSNIGKMYRSFLWRNPMSRENSLAATYSEGTNTVKVWDAATGADKYSLSQLAKVRDICFTRVNEKNLLNVLTETSLKVFEMQNS